jgi:hypothetical protein
MSGSGKKKIIKFQLAISHSDGEIFDGNRETVESWPLLTVEIESNGDSKSTNERGPSLVSSLGLSCRYKGFLSRIGSSNQPSTQYFNPFVSIAQQAGQAVVLGRLSLSMCLWVGILTQVFSIN